MAEVGKSRNVGQGFFNAQGSLKNKEELSPSEEAKKNRSTQSNQQASSQAVIKETVTTEKIQSTFSRFSARLSEQSNAVIEVANRADNNLKEGGQLATKAIKAAKDLREAIKNEDVQGAGKARELIATLEAQRAALKAQTDQENQEDDSRRTQNLNVGDKQLGIVRVSSAKLSSADPERKLETKKEVNEFINELKQERDSIKTQRNEIDGTRNDIASVIKVARGELSNIESKTISSFSEAEEVSSSVAQQVVSNRSQALLASRLNASTVASLLA